MSVYSSLILTKLKAIRFPWADQVNARLVFSFGALALIAIVASAIGLMSYERVESAFRQVTDDRIPVMAAAFQMVEITAALSSDASTLATVSNPRAHAEAAALIQSHKNTIRDLLDNLSSSALTTPQVRPLEVLTRDLFGSLLDLERRVGGRLELIERRRRAVAEMSIAHRQLLDWLTPKIDDANFDLVIRTESTTSALSSQIETLMTDGVSTLQAALTLSAAINLSASVIIEAALAPDRGVLEAAADRFTATKAAIEEQLAVLSEHRRFKFLKGQVETLVALGDGPDGIFAQRRKMFGSLSSGLTPRLNMTPSTLTKEVYRPHEAILIELEPIIDDASFDLIVLSEAAVNDSSGTIRDLVDQSVDTLRSYLNIAADGNWLAGLLRQASVEQDAAVLGPLSEQIRAAMEHLLEEQSGVAIADPSKAELHLLLESLFKRATGPNGIIDLRAAEIGLERKQEVSVELTHDLAAMLTQAVNKLVDTTGADVMVSSQSVDEAISQGRWLLVGLSVTIVLIAAAIVVRESGFRREIEKAARELQDHHDGLKELVEERTRTVAEQAEELRTALEAEKELSGLQRQFVSMVCHEFRTPLAVIDGNAQRLIRRHDKIEPERLKGGLGKIRTSVIRLTDLMESVLSAARLEAGSIRFEPEPHSLADLIQEVAGNHMEVSSGYKIVTDLGQLPESIFIDAKLMRQVISNLISNAIKYSPEGTCVWVNATSTEDGGVQISFQDEGVGIPAAELEMLFERFFRASTSTGIAGTGIGLHMVKTLVDMHGGMINVASLEGEGTTFTVYLPQTEVRAAGANNHTDVAA